ncbi:MAG: succinate--CoA ligase subunit beta [Thermodesulfobacteriota bacterium]
MRIYEYEVKDLLGLAGIATPRRELVHDASAAQAAAQRLGGPVALKAQTLIKARGKAGLIQFADTPAQAAERAAALLGRQHHGEKVASLLVEEKLSLAGELYLGIVVDYTNSRPMILASREGGVEVEGLAALDPAKILRLPVSPALGLTPEQAQEAARFLAGGGAGEGLVAELTKVVAALYSVFVARDLEMLEVNPLALTTGGKVVALDGAAAVDGDALFRQPALARPRNQSPEEFARESDFRDRGWTYLGLDGDIGILSSGAGITMAILDLMRMWGGRPANFLDTAQMDRQGIYDAFQIFKDNPAIKTVLVNIFAGLNRCDHLAEGIKDFLEQHHPKFKLVVRMAGNREEEGKAILEAIGVTPIRELEAAVQKAIEVTEDRR